VASRVVGGESDDDDSSPGWTTTPDPVDPEKTGGDGDQGSDADLPSACLGAEQLRITEVFLEPAQPPEWNPGETLLMDLTVTAVGEAYSGDVLITQITTVGEASPTQTTGGIGDQHLAEGDSRTLDGALEADADVLPGTLVTVVARIATIPWVPHPDCPNLDAVQFEAYVE
jgi:hypothetical protein